MMESPIIIQMNIAHYRALLELDMDSEKRAAIQRLLAKAIRELTLASVSKQ